MSSNKRKVRVAPSPKPKDRRPTASNSGSESSVPQRYYSTTTAASSSVALSDTDNENNITITGHPTQLIFNWTPSEQSTTVVLSDTEAASDNSGASYSPDSDDSDVEVRRKPWWKRKRVLLGIAFAVAGILAFILGASLSWAYLSPKKNINDDDQTTTEGFFKGPYETRSLSERVADKHTNRGRLHRLRGRINREYNPNVKQRDQYLPVKKNPYRKHGAGKHKNRSKAYSSNGKGNPKGRFLDFGNAEQGQFNENVNRYDQVQRRKQLKNKNKAQNTDIRNFTNPVATDPTKSVEIPGTRSPPGQPVEKEMIPRNGFKLPFNWPLGKKVFECPPNGCPTKNEYDITHKNGLRNKETGPIFLGVPFNNNFKLLNSTFEKLLYKIQENIRNRVG